MKEFLARLAAFAFVATLAGCTLPEPGQPAEFVSTSTTSNGADGGRNRDEDDEDDEEPQGPSREFLLIRRPSYRKILSDLGGSIHMIPGKENISP